MEYEKLTDAELVEAGEKASLEMSHDELVRLALELINRIK